MDATNPVRRNGRRGKATKETTVESTTDSPAATEQNMAEQTKTTSNGDAKTEITALSLKPNAEQASSGVAGMISVSGDRPIAVSNLDVYGTILNNRPIMASHIKVLDVTAVGGRPIFASDLVIREDLSLPGGRPVFASDPHLLEASMLPGGRPIASNEIDDAETLMGFID
ncbi:hypothetical protein H6G89_28665 [Oscillatoria sp. FACHB-1407]|uniref:hypothetical protein n=1 Tax=Oscillatoria sp. FACHB-1407 TaxID=2692847 RepID=UPI0016827D9E|nr:hypothetical protein [Oscillatoria sp. FACHB-1407]MBD2464982.1 hypothetical protein [Oscillatoria sp. FACHB-1407]